MKISNLRWWVCGLLFGATLISYVVRQSMPVVSAVIASEFHSTTSRHRILSSFLLAYAFGQFGAGRFLDWTGARAGLAAAPSVNVAQPATAAVAAFSKNVRLGRQRCCLLDPGQTCATSLVARLPTIDTWNGFPGQYAFCVLKDIT